METWCGGEAGVAQLVEQLTCNQQVGGSIPFASSLRRQDTEPRRETSAPARRPAEGKKSQKYLASRLWNAEPARRPASEEGRYPSGQREQTVNLSASAFGGSNPPLPTPQSGLRNAGPVSRPEAAMVLVWRLPVKSVSLLGPERRACAALRKRGCAGIAQLVERQPSKLGVAGSSPVSRS